MKKEVYEFIAHQAHDTILERRTCPWTHEEFPIYRKDEEMLTKLSPVIGDKRFHLPYPIYSPSTRMAHLIDPSFTKEEVTAAGYLRRDEPIKVDIPAGVQTVKNTELDQFEGVDSAGNRTIDNEILKKVIIDEQGNAYRVIPMELEFLRKHGLPLPRKHWLERMKENFRIS